MIQYICNRCNTNKSFRWAKSNPLTHELELLCGRCYSVLWRSINSSKVEKYHKSNIKYMKEHRDEFREYENAYRRKYILNVQNKLKNRLRVRLCHALKGRSKVGSAIQDLGCSVEFLKAYLESKFLTGMTWDNHGRGQDKWHIDHVKPLDRFDLTNRDQLIEACHYTNLQPLWELDNLKKSNKFLSV